MRLDLSTADTCEPADDAPESGTSDARKWDALWCGARCHLYAARFAPGQRPSRPDLARAYAATLRAHDVDEVTIESLYAAWAFGFDLAEYEAADDAAFDAMAARQRGRRA